METPEKVEQIFSIQVPSQVSAALSSNLYPPLC